MPRTIERTCEFCQTQFNAPVKEVNRGNGRFCSQKCSSSRKYPKSPNTVCAYCNAPFYRQVSHLAGSKSKLYFCCRQHKDLAQRIGGIKDIQPPHYGATLADYREVAFKHYPKVCSRCGYDKYVIVHHKDRDRSNNSIENLEVLCPNCHALEHFNN